MKTTRFLMMFVAAAAMMFASCDKDNENENNQNSPIVGTWEYHEIQENIVRDYTETLMFKADGTATVQFTCYDTYPEGGTWHYGKSMTGPLHHRRCQPPSQALLQRNNGVRGQRVHLQ